MFIYIKMLVKRCTSCVFVDMGGRVKPVTVWLCPWQQ